MEIISIIAVILILLTAFMFSPLGLGGGIFYLPIFLYLLEWEIHLAILGSISLVLTVSIGSRMAHVKGGYADKDVAKIGIPFALIGVICGTVISSKLIYHFGDLAIKFAASFLLIWVIFSTLNNIFRDENDENEILNLELITLNSSKKYKLLCFVGGTTSGALGIGGGMLFVTFHRALFNWKPHRAAGTSYIIETWIVPVGIISHLIIDQSGPELLDEIGLWIFFIGIVVFLSSWLGAKTAIKIIPQDFLIYPFLLAIIVSLIRYSVDIFSYY